jgi:hypothetical protein
MRARGLGRRLPVVVCAALVLAPAAWAREQPRAAEARDPRLRLLVQVGQGDTNDVAELLPEVQRALARQKAGALLTAAVPGQTSDLLLTLARRAMFRIWREELKCTLAGLAFTEPGGRPVPVSGEGATWREAVARLLAAVTRLAEEHEPELLRRRPDWPDVGFEFEPLPPGRRKALRIKQGGALVTGVREAGGAQAAGLRPGDVLLALDGRALERAGELAHALYVAPPGSLLALEVAPAEGARRRLTLAVP